MRVKPMSRGARESAWPVPVADRKNRAGAFVFDLGAAPFARSYPPRVRHFPVSNALSSTAPSCHQPGRLVHCLPFWLAGQFASVPFVYPAAARLGRA